MAALPVNTRVLERFTPGDKSIVTINPLSTFTMITANLLDLNKFGGLGLFVSSRTAFDRLPLATFLDTWTIARTGAQKAITFDVNFFHAIPRLEENKKGVRLSAALVNRGIKAAPSKSPRSSRRKSGRISKQSKPAFLERRGLRFAGTLLNVSDDDGIGITLDQADLYAITWGDIFLEGWSISDPAGGGPIPFFIQRLGIQEDRIIIGGSAPGISRVRTNIPAARAGSGMGAGSAVGAGSEAGAGSSVAGKKSWEKSEESFDDKALMELLDEVLKKKKR